MAIACGNRAHEKAISDQHHHPDVERVRLCFAWTEGRLPGVISIEEEEWSHAEQQDTYDPDAAYERYLEDAGAHSPAMWAEFEADRLAEADMVNAQYPMARA